MLSFINRCFISEPVTTEQATVNIRLINLI